MTSPQHTMLLSTTGDLGKFASSFDVLPLGQEIYHRENFFLVKSFGHHRSLSTTVFVLPVFVAPTVWPLVSIPEVSQAT